MFYVNLILIFSFLSLLCESTFAMKLIAKPCSIHDFECQKKLYKHILRSMSGIGLPEYGIPSIDPFVVQNVTLSVLESIEIGMPDGLAKGLRTCILNKVSTNLDKMVFNMDVTCDFTIKGKYKMTAESPNIEALVGRSKINAVGYARVKLEKVNINSEFDFFLRKGDDGEIYFDYKAEGMRYTYDVEGVRFDLDSLMINGYDYSSVITSLLNTSWRAVVESFGRPFMDKVMETFYTFTHKFYDAVPAKDIIIEDLSPYILM